MAHDLFLTLDFPPSRGGVARYYDALLRELPQRRIVVLAPDQTNAAPGQVPENVTVKRAGLLGPPWLWPRWLPLFLYAAKEIARERPALLHAGQVLPVGTVALLLKRLFGVPYIVYTHGLDLVNARNQRRKRTVARRVLRDAAAIIVNSSFTERVAREFVRRDATIIRVLPGCTLNPSVVSESEQQRFLDAHGLRRKRLVVTIARLVARKGIATSLRAFARVVKQVPDAAYVVVGEGPERSALERLSAELGLNNHVRFIGGVPDNELAHWLHACEVFVLVPTALGGTDVEGFGIVYLEAGAFAKPVVASRTGGVSDAVRDGVTGLVVPPDDPGATAAAILRLLSDPALGRRLGERGKQIVRTDGSWAQRSQALKTWLAAFPTHS